MSGGHWDYENDDLRTCLFGYDSETFSAKKHNIVDDIKISALIFDVFKLLHDYDWYASGDTCEDTWNEQKKAFKDKWFSSESNINEMLIDGYLTEIKEDMLKIIQ